MDSERRYSDKEVDALLARAVELARPGDASRPAVEGITLTELERIASEAGLPAYALHRALSEGDAKAVVRARSLRDFLFTEKPMRRLRLPSMPSKDELEALLMDLPDLVGHPGSGSLAAGRLAWRSDGSVHTQNGQIYRLKIEAERDGPGALFEIVADLDGAAAGIYGGVVGGLGLGAGLGIGLSIGLGVLNSAAFATLVPIASTGLSFLLARGIMKLASSWMGKRIARIEEEIARRFG